MREVTEFSFRAEVNPTWIFMTEFPHPNHFTMREIIEIIQYGPVKYTYLLTSLVIGVMIGISIGDYQNINCEKTSNSYCSPLDSLNTRRSF